MKLTDISTIRALLREHESSLKKKYGQNFLINESVPIKIADMGVPSKDAGIIEIGPGIGVLTNELCKRAKKVVTIEIDTSLRPILEKTVGHHDNLTIIYNDVLKVDIKSLVNEHFSECDEICVCANLPYYITTPILMYLLESKIGFKYITVMVQKEVAQRLCAPAASPEYGAITASLNYYGKAKRLFTVSAGSFLPAPKVDSAVVQIELYKTSPFSVTSEEMLFRVIKAAFMQRRKTLINALSSEFTEFDKAELTEIVTSLGHKETVRGESLDIKDFILLANKIDTHMNKV